MGSRLLNKSNAVLRMQDLKDGQVAEVIEAHYTGTIVHIYETAAIAIGERSGKSWAHIVGNTLMVRLLEDGELIEIFSNK